MYLNTGEKQFLVVQEIHKKNRTGNQCMHVCGESEINGPSREEN